MDWPAIQASAERILSQGLALVVERASTAIISRVRIKVREVLGGVSGAEVEQLRRKITFYNRAQKVALLVTALATPVAAGVLLREADVACRPISNLLAFPITCVEHLVTVFSSGTVGIVQQNLGDLVCGTEESRPLAIAWPVSCGAAGLAAYKCFDWMKQWSASDIVRRNGDHVPFEVTHLL